MENYSNRPDDFGWDSIIENESSFVLLPEGEYPFTVTGFERGHHNGSEKLPPCPKAILTVEIDGGEKGRASVKHSLFVSRKTEGLLCAFFLSIGRKKHGEPLKMDWSNLVGVTGRCKVGIRVSNTNGNEYNEIKSFLEPAAPAVAAPTYQAPAGGFAPPRFGK